MNEPLTIWKPTNGQGDYIDVGVIDIVDSSGNLLVDPSGNNIVSTGQDFTQIPNTIWINSDGS